MHAFINRGMQLSDVTKVIIPNVAATMLEGDLVKIKKHCTQFLNESGGFPVYKTLNRNDHFVKVKARLRKHNSQFSETFNNAFQNVSNLRQRAIFAHGQMVEGENYYLFPTDGYQYVYNSQIQDSSTLKAVQESLQDPNVFTELLQHNYTNQNLVEGINSGAELLFHNIPFCYAVNTGSIDSYEELLSVVS